MSYVGVKQIYDNAPDEPDLVSGEVNAIEAGVEAELMARLITAGLRRKIAWPTNGTDAANLTTVGVKAFSV